MTIIILSFLGGVLTILAPCILLPLPILLAGTLGTVNKRRPLFLVGGFVFTFTILGLALNFLVNSFNFNPQILRNGAIFLIVGFALFLLWPANFEKLVAQFSGFVNSVSKLGKSAGSGNFGSFVMGAVLGIIWTPCAGPILGSILTLQAVNQDLSKAGLLLFSFALGTGVPLLLIAYGGQIFFLRVRRVSKYSHRLNQIFGIILIFIAGSLYFQYDIFFQQKVLEKLPALSNSLERKLICKFKSFQISSVYCQASEDDLKSNYLSVSDNPRNAGLLANLGPAPEFTKITKWHNIEDLSLQSLRGKVVLIEFWTYSCANCLNVVPYLSQWQDTYKESGFVVVGIHTPEFAYEKSADNVTAAIKRLGITYPVGQDNSYTNWNAYNNRFWPAQYLVDRQGNLRYVHFGEGEYKETESAIKTLLDEDMKPAF